jgi:hypothetical protein
LELNIANLIQLFIVGPGWHQTLTMTVSFFGYLIPHLSASSRFLDISCIRLRDLFLVCIANIMYHQAFMSSFVCLAQYCSFILVLSRSAIRTLVRVLYMLCTNVHVLTYASCMRTSMYVCLLLLKYAWSLVHNMKNNGQHGVLSCIFVVGPCRVHPAYCRSCDIPDAAPDTYK